ncbi:MAG: hypothetical protein ABI758_00385 [Candidatus Woesebacteria bacterium]
MAKNEFFQIIADEIAKQFLLDKATALAEQSAGLYTEVSTLIRQKKYTEAKEIQIEAELLSSDSALRQENYQRLINEFALKVVAILQEFGITEEIPASFFASFVTSFPTQFEEVNDSIDSPVNSPAVDTREYRESKHNLTNIQYIASLITLRLITVQAERASVREAIYEYVFLGRKDDPDFPYTEGQIKMGLKQNWKGAERKLRRGIDIISAQRQNEVSIPFTEKELLQFESFAELEDIYRRMNQIPAYQGMTWDEIVEYTQTLRPIGLHTRDSHIQEDTERKESPVRIELSIEELQYIAATLYNSDVNETLSDTDKDILLNFANWSDERIERSDEMLNSVLKKLEMFYEGDETQKGIVIDAQSADGQMLLAIAIGSWQSLQDAQDQLRAAM